MASNATSGPDLLAEVEKDIEEFEQFFVKNLDNSGPLTRSEKAILKTFLHWALVDRKG